MYLQLIHQYITLDEDGSIGVKLIIYQTQKKRYSDSLLGSRAAQKDLNHGEQLR